MIEVQLVRAWLSSRLAAARDDDAGAGIVETVVIIGAFVAAAIIIVGILVAKATGAAKNVQTQ